MAKLTPTEAADKMIRRVSAATEDINRGIDRVTESPTEAAAASQEFMLSQLVEAIQSGKWADSLRNVTLAQWKQAFKEKGVPRIAPGIRASKGKIEAFFRDFLPYLDQAQAEVKAMPRDTLDQRIERSSAMQRKLAQYSKR